MSAKPVYAVSLLLVVLLAAYAVAITLLYVRRPATTTVPIISAEEMMDEADAEVETKSAQILEEVRDEIESTPAPDVVDSLDPGTVGTIDGIKRSGYLEVLELLRDPGAGGEDPPGGR